MRDLKAVVSLTLALMLPWFAWGSAGLTYHGRLIKPNGAPVTASNVQFRLQIRTPLPTNCLMYEEVHTKDLSGSAGTFSITLNEGATTPNAEPFTLAEAFQNRGTLNFPSSKCSVDNTFTPSASSGRRLLVSFNDGTFSGWEPLPAQEIAFIPLALESITVGGHKPGNFFRVENAGTPQNLGPWSVASYQKLTELVANTTITGGNASIGGNAAGFTGSLNGDVTGGQTSTRVEKIQGRSVLDASPSNGQVLTWNNAQTRWEPANLPAASAPAWNDITGKPATFPAGGSAGGDLSGTYPDPVIANNAVTSAKIVDGGVSFSKIAAGSVTGQVLRYETGTGWSPTKLNFMDLVNSIGGSPWPGAPCSAGEAIVWQSAPDRFVCQAISFTETDPKVGANSTNKLSKWNGTALVESGVFESGGNVGIGTTSPAYALELEGVTAASRTIAIGGAPMFFSPAGTSSIAIGDGLRNASYSGDYDLAVGQGALPAVTTGFQNTAVGLEALSTLQDGYSNTALGAYAGWSAVGARESVYLGKSTTASSAGVINEVVIGANNAGSGSNSVTLGNSSITKTVLRGNVGIGTVAPGDKLHVEGKIRAQELCDETGANCKDISTGWSVPSSLSGDVSGAFGATSVDKIKGKAVVPVAYSTGQVLRYDGTNWVNAVIDLSTDVTGALPLTSTSGTLPITRGGTGAVSQQAAINNLLPSQGSNAGKILQTDGTNVSWVVPTDTGITALTGDVTASGSGSVAATIASNAVTSAKISDGTIVGTDMNFTGVNTATSGLVMKDSTGKFSNFSCATTGHVPTWTVSGFACQTPTDNGLTSVGLTMPGVFTVTGSPLTSNGTLAVSANGTSGGIPYFSSATTMASSGVLTQYQVVLGGGAGTAPSVVSGTGTTGQVLTSNGSGSAPTWQAVPAGVSGSGTSGYLSKFTGASAIGNSVLFESGGNVGIGTTAPATNRRLHVVSPDGTTGPASFESQYAGSSGSYIDLRHSRSGASLNANDNMGGIYFSGMTSDNTTWADGANIFSGMPSVTTGSESGNLQFWTRHLGTRTEKMRIESTGNVGIGTTSPLFKLHVESNDSVSGGEHIIALMRRDTNGGGFVLGYEADGSQVVASRIRGSGNYDLRLGTNSNPDVMTIGNNSNVGIGTTTPGAGTKLRVNGQIASKSASGSSGTIDWANGNAQSTSFDCSSNISMVNLRDGGAYTLVVTSASTTQCSFATAVTGDDAGTLTYRFLPANAARIANSHSVYSLQRVGSFVYISWLTGF